jgi:hypothetical protein
MITTKRSQLIHLCHRLSAQAVRAQQNVPLFHGLGPLCEIGRQSWLTR